MLPRNLSALVADDHELFAFALRALLQRDLKFGDIALASSFETALKLLAANSDISLLTLDIGMPGMAGGSSVREIRNSFPKLRTIIVSAAVSREQVLEALSWGIHGYLPKTLPVQVLAQALRIVMNGQIYVPETLSNVADNGRAASEPGPEANAYAGHATQPRLGACVDIVERSLASVSPGLKLSARQRDVLDLLAQGQSNKQIARKLGLAEGTVKVHINGLYRALQVNNRAGAVATRAVSADLGLRAAAVPPPIGGLTAIGQI